MQYKTISYKQIRNLGNYQSETLEITVELSEGEDINKAIEKLKTKVLKSLYPECINFSEIMKEIERLADEAESMHEDIKNEIDDFPY